MVTGIIYCWKNKVNNKIYIGSTSAPNRRIYDHLRRSTNPELREDFVKYGLPSFEFTILEFIEFTFATPKEDIRKQLWGKEQHYVDELLIENGELKPCAYNMCASVSGEGRTYTEKQRKNMSDGGKGKVLSESHKKRISDNHNSKQAGFVSWTKGKSLSNAHRLAISTGQTNRKTSVAQYNKEGVLVGVFSSLSDATKHNKFTDSSNISRCISQTNRTYKTFYWRKTNNDTPPPHQIETPIRPKIKMYDSSMKLLGVYKNSFTIEKMAGVHHTVVNAAITKQSQTKTGFYFEYEK